MNVNSLFFEKFHSKMFFRVNDLYDFQHYVINEKYLKKLLESISKNKYKSFFDDIILDLYLHDLFSILLIGELSINVQNNFISFTIYSNNENYLLKLWKDKKYTLNNEYYNSNIPKEQLLKSIEELIKNNDKEILENSFKELHKLLIKEYLFYKSF